MQSNPFLHQIIPSGSLRLDYAIGCGGFPCGEYIELRGPESSGKTTLCLHSILEAQKQGGLCAIIDSDHAIYPALTYQYQFDPERLFISQPDSAEQALNILDSLVESGVFNLIVLDSLTSLIPQKEIELPLWKSSNISVEKLLSNKLNKLGKSISKAGTCILFTSRSLSQISDTYHDLSKNPSRLAIGLQAALRLELQTGKNLHGKVWAAGRTIRIKIIKNTIHPNFIIPEFDIIMYNSKIDKLSEIISFGAQFDIIEKQNIGWRYGDLYLGNNFQDIKSYLNQHTDLADQIEKEIRYHFKIPALTGQV